MRRERPRGRRRDRGATGVDVAGLVARVDALGEAWERAAGYVVPGRVPDDAARRVAPRHGDLAGSPTAAAATSLPDRARPGVGPAHPTVGGTVDDPLGIAALVDRARERVALGVDRTVVAVAGSTGSGKSSLVNALAGVQVAVPGVLRPTTSHPVAAVWPGSSVSALLDWLEVRDWTAVGHAAPDDPAPDDPGPDDPGPDDGGDGGDHAGVVPEGLVLLDLPDHDSVVVEHRARADRLLERADLLVWVTDPQKYADAALHDGYLRPLAGHGDVVVVVLNQVDRLEPGDRERVLDDLRARVADDGLSAARVLATSAATRGAGERAASAAGDVHERALDAVGTDPGVDPGTDPGVAGLRGLVHDAAHRRAAMAARLDHDVRDAARRLLDLCGGDAWSADAVGATRAEDELVEALLDAAGADAVLDAVRGSARRQVHATAGWPVTRWVAGLRADPLRRLGLRHRGAQGEVAQSGGAQAVGSTQGVGSTQRRSTSAAGPGAADGAPGASSGTGTAPSVARSSLPPARPAVAARASQAVRTHSAAVTDALPPAWRPAADARVEATTLADALDVVVTGARLEGRPPGWARAVGWAQGVLLAVAAAGLLWLLVLAGLDYLRLPSPELAWHVGDSRGIPWPTTLLVVGVVLGVLLGALASLLGRATARRRVRRARADLTDGARRAAHELVVAPLAARLDALEATRALARGAGA